MFKQKKCHKGFTLMELIVVIILVAIIAAFAIPNYIESVNKTKIRDAVSQLSTLHSANAIYRARAGGYLSGSNLNLAAINSGLNINLIAGDLTYSYTRSSASAYQASASGSGFAVIVDENPIDDASNPCCTGTCYSILPSC